MYTEISAAVQSAKVISELLKATGSLSNYNELASAVAEVHMKLMEATAVALKGQEKQAELQATVVELERRLLEATQALDRAKDYRLHKFETGALAYEFIGETETTPAHFVCSSCFDKGGHAKLQPHGDLGMKCHTCGSYIQCKFAAPSAPRSRISQGLGRDW